jgi:arylsulfatase A-like enzyme
MPTRPNILLLMTDQMQGRVLEPGHPCQRPNFDRLAARGVRFTRATTPSATCSPARASLMTGRLPHSHGVFEVTHCTDLDQNRLRENLPHWAQRLRQAGYFTGYVGKWHVDREESPGRFGWQIDASQHSQRWRQQHAADHYSEDDFMLMRANDQPPGYRAFAHYAVTREPPEQRNIGQCIETAMPILDEAAASGQPWCCVLSCHAPHDPFIAGQEAYSRYRVDDLPLPASACDDLAGRPYGYAKIAAQWRGLTDDQQRQCMACYYAMISEIDTFYGRVLDWLDRTGQAENTIVVLTSDHGELLGAHGLYCKNISAFEEVYHIPLVMAGPGIAAGATSSARVGLHELGPTLLELAGAEPIDTAGESRSFADVLGEPAGRAAAERQQAYAEYFGNVFRYTQRVLWDGNWKFVFNGYDRDELYNLDDDPAELRNLIDEAAHRHRAVSMMKRIWQIADDSGDPMSKLNYPGCRTGMVGPRA